MLKKYTLFLFFSLILFTLFLLSFMRFYFSTADLENYFLKSIKNNHSIIYFGDSVIKADHIKNKTPSNLVNILESKLNSSILDIV